MDLSGLTDYQLYELVHNVQLDNDIRKLAIAEFSHRNLTKVQLAQLESRHNEKLKPITDQPLEIKYKILLLLFPFVISTPIQAIIAIKYLVRGQKRKWKDYWLYISLGYLIWTIAIILFCRLFLFTTPIS